MGFELLFNRFPDFRFDGGKPPYQVHRQYRSEKDNKEIENPGIFSLHLKSVRIKFFDFEPNKRKKHFNHKIYI
ncbi:MAG: hypothetical protein Kow0042_03080 [Calditrichia bacterium]